jgi:hypothetical protein
MGISIPISDIFFNNILDLFDDEDWADETLGWWTEYVIPQNRFLADYG